MSTMMYNPKINISAENPGILDHVAVSSGSGKDDFERLSEILRAVPQLSYVCLDVANGYTQHFVEFVRKTRSTFPTHTIIVSGAQRGAYLIFTISRQETW